MKDYSVVAAMGFAEEMVLSPGERDGIAAHGSNMANCLEKQTPVDLVPCMEVNPRRRVEFDERPRVLTTSVLIWSSSPGPLLNIPSRKQASRAVT